MADTSYINNVQDLDQILFFSGQHSIAAASYVANRDYDKIVDDLGTLSNNSNYEIFYSQYPDVKYTEKRTNFANLNELFETTLSYLYSKEDSDFSIGTAYAGQNRYHANYTYEVDLENDLDNGEIFITRDLNDFLIGLNSQTFNKQKFYGGKYEISSVKIDNTYYNWYPKDSVAYTNRLVDLIYTYSLIDCIFNTNGNNIYDGELPANENVVRAVLNVINANTDLFKTENETTHELESKYTAETTLDDFLKILVNKEIVAKEFKFNTEKTNQFINQINGLGILPNQYYLHATIDSKSDEKVSYIDYIIGGETGDYYSYVKSQYIPIEEAIKDKITYKLDIYKHDVCNNDPSIYAYYVDRCDTDLELLLSTLNFGVKQSTFKIDIESRFARWFDDTIDIKADVAEGDEILKISAYKNGEIFSLLKNNIDRISGENVEINNKEIPHTFISTTNISKTDDTINILTPGSIETLDLSPLKTKISNVVDLTGSNWQSNRINMKSIIFDDGNDSTKSNIEKLFGLNDLSTIEYIDISNINKFKTTPAIDKLENLKVFKAKNSNIDSFRPKKGITMNYVQLPDSVKSIKLDTIKFEEGEVDVFGEKLAFDGVFDYAPTKNLISLTLRNVDDELSYNLVNDWYDVLNAENLLDTMIYLELQGIKWDNVPVQRMINLRRFDVNPNLSGEVTIYGSGNWKYLTRKEYQSMVNLYGVNAFFDKSIISGKTFKDLLITNKSKVETFEYSLGVSNDFITEHNEENAGDRSVTKYKDNLKVKFNYYTSSGAEVEAYPYYNRAANSILDLIEEKNASDNKEFVFKKGELGGYVYCKLDRSIDTSSSVEVKNIAAGDILLLNGDTIVIFFESNRDNNIEYIKLGRIVDENVKNIYDLDVSSLSGWFELMGEDMKLRFISSERATVIQELTITKLSEDENILFDNNPDGINVAIDIDAFAKEHIDEVEEKEISVEFNRNLVNVVEVGESNRNGHYRLYNIKPVADYDFSNINETPVVFYSPAEKDATSVKLNVVLRKFYHPSYVEDETLILDSEMYSVIDDELIINAQIVNTIYDDSTETLTID